MLFLSLIFRYFFFFCFMLLEKRNYFAGFLPQ